VPTIEERAKFKEEPKAKTLEQAIGEEVRAELKAAKDEPKLPVVSKPNVVERYNQFALINRHGDVPQYEKTLAAMRRFPLIFSHDRLRDRYYISNNPNDMRNIDGDSFDNVVENCGPQLHSNATLIRERMRPRRRRFDCVLKISFIRSSTILIA
jgi:hypothetical protein